MNFSVKGQYLPPKNWFPEYFYIRKDNFYTLVLQWPYCVVFNIYQIYQIINILSCCQMFKIVFKL